MGAPQAAQVADRWHLFVNLREAFERLLARLRPELQLLVPVENAAKLEEIPLRRQRARAQATEASRQERQKRRRALYAKIQRLHKQGTPVQGIARQLEKSPTTIYKYLTMPEFPQQLVRKRIASILDPYADYLKQRWRGAGMCGSWGVISAAGLYRDLSPGVALGIYPTKNRLIPPRASTWKKMNRASWS